MRKHGHKVLGLAFMAALGLMAFTASAAQAVNLELGDNPGSGIAGFILSGGVTAPATGALAKETIGGEQVGSGRLLVPEKKIEIVCAKANIVEGYVNNEFEDWSVEKMTTGGHGHATILYLECETWEINAEHKLVKKLPDCNPNPAGLKTLPASDHVTANVLFLIKRHEIEPGVFRTLIIFEPLVKSKTDLEKVKKLEQPFTTIEFGELCSLPPKVNVTGAVAALAPLTDAVEPELSLNTLGDPDQELVGTKLKFGANSAFIEGKAKLKLLVKTTLAWGAM